MATAVMTTTIIVTITVPEGRVLHSNSPRCTETTEWGKTTLLCFVHAVCTGSNSAFHCLGTPRLYFRASNYCRTLEGLIKIAPPPQKNYPFATKLSQTILVTHYFQPSSNDSQKGGDDSEDDNDVHIYGYRGEDRTGQSAGEGNEEEDGIGTASAAEVSQEVRSDASASLNRTPSTDDDNTVKSDDGVTA